MYKDGLIFPIFYFFLNDDVSICSIEEIKRQKNSLFEKAAGADYININDYIVNAVNTTKGFDLLPTLLNVFPDSIQSKTTIKKHQIESDFIKDNFEFLNVLNTFKVDFDAVEYAIKQIENIATVDRTLFYKELYLLLYKSFVLKLGKNINYSDNPSAKLYLDFKKDFKKFMEYSQEIEKTRPVLIRNYEFKKEYIKQFYKSFKADDIEEISKKMELIQKCTPSLIRSTFQELIRKTFVFSPAVTSNERNKLFKTVYIEVMSCITSRTFEDNDKTNAALTKEIKRFLSNK